MPGSRADFFSCICMPSLSAAGKCRDLTSFISALHGLKNPFQVPRIRITARLVLSSNLSCTVRMETLRLKTIGVVLRRKPKLLEVNVHETV